MGNTGSSSSRSQRSKFLGSMRFRKSHRPSKSPVGVADGYPEKTRRMDIFRLRPKEKSRVEDNSSVPTMTDSTTSSTASPRSFSAEPTVSGMGRVYHVREQSQYHLPMDAGESDRLILTHYILKQTFNANYLAPIRNLLSSEHGLPVEKRPRVLDIGCGPGTWTLEMATEFPNTEFYGIDLQEQFPSAIKPANTTFMVADARALPFDDNSFDFVFVRQLLALIPKADVNAITAEVYRVLKPGAYFEVIELEYMPWHTGPTTAEIARLVCEYLRKEDQDLLVQDHLQTSLLRPMNTTGGGFVDIHDHILEMPLGWGGTIGDLNLKSYEMIVRYLDPSMVIYVGDQMQVEGLVDVDHFSDETVNTINREHIECKAHTNWYLWYCRKKSTPATDAAAANSTALYNETENDPSEQDWELRVKELVGGYVD